MVPIQDIRPGAVLATDVHDSYGRFLLRRGVAIEEGHMRILRIWGVTDVDIEQVEGSPEFDRDEVVIPPETLRQAEEVVALRLGPRTEQEHVAVAELRRIFSQFTAQRLLAEGVQETSGFDRLQTGASQMDPRGDPIDIQAFLDKDLNLASLPTVFNRILSAINNPHSSAAHLAEVIGQDPSLSAKLLRIANSPFYGFPGKIENISRAVTIVGTRQLGTLALGTSVVEKFQDIPDRLMDMEAFWKQSIACGIGARFLGSLKSLSNTESFFVAGLIHGLGQLVLLRFFPAQAGQALSQSRTRNISLTESERRIFGFNHAWLGGEIMRRWRLPRRIEQSVRHQYTPLQSEYPAETTVLHVAGILARGMALGSVRALPIPALDCGAWYQLQFTPGTLSSTLNHMVSQVDATYRLLFKVPGARE